MDNSGEWYWYCGTISDNLRNDLVRISGKYESEYGRLGLHAYVGGFLAMVL